MAALRWNTEGAGCPFRAAIPMVTRTIACAQGAGQRFGFALMIGEFIVNEFLIVRPLACFAGIERNVRVVRKGMLVPGLL